MGEIREGSVAPTLDTADAYSGAVEGMCDEANNFIGKFADGDINERPGAPEFYITSVVKKKKKLNNFYVAHTSEESIRDRPGASIERSLVKLLAMALFSLSKTVAQL